LDIVYIIKGCFLWIIQVLPKKACKWITEDTFFEYDSTSPRTGISAEVLRICPFRIKYLRYSNHQAGRNHVRWRYRNNVGIRGGLIMTAVEGPLPSGQCAGRRDEVAAQ